MVDTGNSTLVGPSIEDQVSTISKCDYFDTGTYGFLSLVLLDPSTRINIEWRHTSGMSDLGGDRRIHTQTNA
jgi:hypothetical protein